MFFQRQAKNVKGAEEKCSYYYSHWEKKRFDSMDTKTHEIKRTIISKTATGIASFKFLVAI